MQSLKITSRHNPLAKRARSVRDGREGNQIFIEGLRLAEEALRSRLTIPDALYTERFGEEERGARLLEELAEGSSLSLVSEDVLASISDTKAPQGIVLLALRPHTRRDALLTGAKAAGSQAVQAEASGEIKSSLIVIIHGINNPANAGAIVRTAEAAGATGIISTKGSTDLLSPKALRGAMGSSFRLPLWEGADFYEAVAWCKEKGVRTIGSSLQSTKRHSEADWTKPCALVIGSEAAGLSASEVRILDEAVRIPMRAPVESLNAAVAAGIILYEAAKQRMGDRG